MAPADIPICEPMWRLGFYEMRHAMHASVQSSPLPFLLLTSLGVGAALAFSSPAAGMCLAGCGLLLYTPLGAAALSALLWQAIKRQRLGEPTPATPFWVAQSAATGEVLGCVCAREKHTLYREAPRGAPVAPREASVWRLTVAPGARRTGAGRALMGAAEEWARARGCTHLSLITGNPDSARFYRALGYGPEDRARARRVLWGAEGAPWGPLALVKDAMLPRRLAKTVFCKALS